METEKGMRSIWFFVGLIMLIIGILVLLAGIYEWINPTVHNVRLTRLHTNIWWGILIAVVGAIYTIKNKNKYVKD